MGHTKRRTKNMGRAKGLGKATRRDETTCADEATGTATATTAANAASREQAQPASQAGSAAVHGVGLDLIVREVVEAGVAKTYALLRLYIHSRKVRAAARELAAALGESRDVWNWPGDRLPVGDEMSQQVEKLTRRLKLETEAHHRFEALFKTVGWGRSVAAV
ncbi:hypothetical protein ACFYLX_19010 [Pseudarthrobacter enclensis]|uniref:hypothetical protein n=1 Tax=Pseudarthrobacter enclensis TaxID=993070 RepID=UPI0036B058B9